jgi:DNA-binding CsgD family transcriptional regulator
MARHIDDAAPVSLSPREHNIIEMIGQGHCNKAIARHFGITVETVKSHLKRAFIKLEVESRGQAVLRAQLLGILQSDRVPTAQSCAFGSLRRR